MHTDFPAPVKPVELGLTGPASGPIPFTSGPATRGRAGAVPGYLRRKLAGELAEVLGPPEIANAARNVETQLGKFHGHRHAGQIRRRCGLVTVLKRATYRSASRAPAPHPPPPAAGCRRRGTAPRSPTSSHTKIVWGVFCNLDGPPQPGKLLRPGLRPAAARAASAPSFFAERQR